MSTLHPDYSVIANHLAALHTCAEGTNGLLILASFGEDPETGHALTPMVSHYAIGDCKAMTDCAMEWSALAHRNVYAPLAVMRQDLKPGAKGGEADIVKVLGLVADFDDEEAPNWGARVPIVPTAILQTSPKRFQCFYLFDRPLDPGPAKDLARRLRASTQCDHGTEDVSHVWRIGGALNWPNAKKAKAGRALEPCPVIEIPGGVNAAIKVTELDHALPVLAQPSAKPVPRPAQPVAVDDRTLLDRMFHSPNGAKIRKLWNGDWSAHPSQSEADSALAYHLAYWFSRDATRIDQLFRQSGLYRPKWDEQHGERTYGATTLSRACENCRDTYPASRAVLTEEATPDGPDDLPSHELRSIEDPEPIPLDEQTVPTLPAHSIPADWLCDMVDSEAAATETPVELALLLGLAVVATTVQKKFIVEPEPGYSEPLNLWTCPALDSGCRKTKVLEAMTAPLLDYEKQYAVEHGPRLAQAAAQRLLADERIKHLRLRAAKAEGPEAEKLRQELFEAESSIAEVPKPLRLWAQDVTPEKLGEMMADQGEKLAILSDEGGLFDILAGRYSKGVPNIDLFLQAHSGSQHRVDRSSRPSIFMDSPALTLGLSPQPAVLRGLAKIPEFRGRGLIARFLYALPRSPLGGRTNVSQPVPAEVSAQYRASIHALLLRPPRVDRHPHRLHFSPEALREWKAFQNHVEVELRAGGKFENVTDWAGKLPGGCARLAGILHCATHADGEPELHLVSLPTMEAALNIGALLEQHALAVFSLMAVDSTLDAANKVWGWVTRRQKTTFYGRDCFHALQGSFHKMAAIQPAFDTLLERAYLFLLPVTPSRSSGRPSSPQYRVNHRLTKGWL